MINTNFRFRSLLALLWIAISGLALAAELDGGDDCGAPGGSALIPVTFTNDALISGLQFDVTFDPELVFVTDGVQPGTALADHLVSGREVSPGVYRVLIYSPTTQQLGSGEIAIVPFSIQSDTTDVQIPLELPLSGTGSYVGPGPILASIGAVKTLPAPNPDPGAIELIRVAVDAPTGECIGGTAGLSCSSTGPGPATYQWLRNNSEIPGATSASYQIPVVEPFDTGQYRCRVVDSVCGEVLSANAPFIVDDEPCAPENLRVYDPGTGGTLVAEWQPNPSSSIDGYTLRWGSMPGGPYVSSRVLLPSGTANLSALNEGERLYFRISAAVAGNESPFSNEDNAVPTSNGFDLPQAPDYGYNAPNSGDTAHADVLTYRFPPRSGDVTIWFDGFDIDSSTEVAVRINGEPVICRDEFDAEQPCVSGEPGNWSGKTTLTLPDAQVKDDAVNVLTFDNVVFDDPPATEEQWALRNVSIKLPAPDVTAQPWSRTVDLAITQGDAEPTLASYDVYRDVNPEFLISSASRLGTCSTSGALCDLFNPCGAGQGSCQATGFLGSVFRDNLALLNGNTYYYVVRPVDTIGNSGFDSTELSARPNNSMVTPIVDLRVDSSGPSDIELAWSRVITAQGVANYEIYDGTLADAVSFTGETTSGTSFARTGDQADGQTHYYFVIVVDNNGRRSEHRSNP